MEAVVGAVAEEVGLLDVGALVHEVAFLVVHGGEVVGVDLDAHLDAEVVRRCRRPRRWRGRRRRGRAG